MHFFGISLLSGNSMAGIMMSHWLKRQRAQMGNSRSMKKLLFAISVSLLSITVHAQPPDIVRAHDAKNHVGEIAMVCGVIASAKYQKNSRGEPTHLNFDKPYPDQDFSAILFGKNRKNFKVKPETFSGYEACVYGKIRMYKGKAQIELIIEKQLAVKAPG